MRNFRPDWNNAPPWAKWWAVDSNGFGYWYEAKPSISFNCKYWWEKTICGRFENSGDKFESGDGWEESLQERPNPLTY